MYPISLSCRFSFWPWAFQEQWGSSHRAAQFLAFEWCRAGAARHPKSFATCIIELQSLGSFAKWIDSSWEPGQLKKCFGSKKWCWCWRAEVIWVSIWLNLVSCFFMQDQRLNQFIEWRLSMYIIADPKMKKVADKVFFSSFHTRMIRCVWSMRWSYLAAIFRFCKCSRRWVVSEGVENRIKESK